MIKSLGFRMARRFGSLQLPAFMLVALCVLAFLFRGALRYLANFMPEAKQLLDALASWWYRLWTKRSVKTDRPSQPEVRTPPPRRRFTSFLNPPWISIFWFQQGFPVCRIRLIRRRRVTPMRHDAAVCFFSSSPWPIKSLTRPQHQTG